MNRPKGVAKKLGLILAVPALIAGTTLVLFLHHKKTPAPSPLAISDAATAAATPTPAPLPSSVDAPATRAAAPAPAPSASWQAYQVKRGDTLSSIFAQLKLPKPTLLAIQRLHSPELRHLHAGETLNFLIQQGNLLSLQYNLDFRRQAEITLSKDHAHLAIKEKPMTSGLEFKSGVINHSLQAAANQAGLTHAMTAELHHAFPNFHKNDRFELLYREYYVDGQKYKTGDVVAAELISNNQKHFVFRFQDPENSESYYAANGSSLDPMFLSAPLSYKHISSRFSYHRLDPYLHTWRAHLGVDFAADSGTPIRSIGDGRIVFIGRDGGYGNAIKIQYGRAYQALYGHMHRFVHGLHVNQYVKKGEIIGYVGSTGWSTGPHLHFSFFVNGVPENWLGISLPYAGGISSRYLPAFEAMKHEMLATLAADEAKLGTHSSPTRDIAATKR